MRKKLLTLALGFSFLFFGAAITKAEVSRPSNIVAVNVSVKYAAEKNLSSLKRELSSLTAKCAMGADCDNALAAANVAYSLAVITCNAQGWGSDGCTSAVGVAGAAADTAASKCESSPQTPPVAEKRKNTLISPEKGISNGQTDSIV